MQVMQAPQHSVLYVMVVTLLLLSSLHPVIMAPNTHTHTVALYAYIGSTKLQIQ